MKKILNMVPLLLVMLFLSGCGAKYVDRYTFVPPKGKDGVVCANDCIKQKDVCSQQCLSKGTVLDLGNKIISKFSGDTMDGDDDKATNKCTRACEENHRVCHVNCGGEVHVHKECVAYCKNAS